MALLILGALKLHAVACGYWAGKTDGVFHISMQTVALLAGGVEILLSVLILGVFRPLRAAQCVTIVGFCFICYRWLHSWRGTGQRCPCLGAATDWIPQLGMYEEHLLFTIAVWILLIGVWSWIKEIAAA